MSPSINSLENAMNPKHSTALALASKGKGRKVQPLPEDLPDDEADNSTELEACREAMQGAWDEFKGHALSAVESGITLGTHARRAKELLGHGGFGEWVASNFPFSDAWARKCMRAAAVVEKINATKTAQKKWAKALALATTIEKLATLEREVFEKPASKVARLERDDEGADDEARTVEGVTRVVDVTTDRMRADLLKEAERLLVLSKALDERERVVALREADCTAREKALLLAAPMVESTGDGPIEALKNAKRKNDAKEKAKADKARGVGVASEVKPIKVRKASRRAPETATSDDQEAVNGMVASTPENGSGDDATL